MTRFFFFLAFFRSHRIVCRVKEPIFFVSNLSTGSKSLYITRGLPRRYVNNHFKYNSRNKFKCTVRIMRGFNRNKGMVFNFKIYLSVIQILKVIHRSSLFYDILNKSMQLLSLVFINI